MAPPVGAAAATSTARASSILLPGLILALVAKSASAAGLPWEIWESPERLATVSAADLVVEHSSHCPQGCRYDRSNAGPEPPDQNPTPQRWLYRDGSEVVLFDERGPGALTRIWMTTGFGVSSCFDASIRIRFRFDGAQTPAIDMPLAALFDGSRSPFTPPLVADHVASSGGFVSRVPIAYAQSLRISLSGADDGPGSCSPWRLIWYQFTAHRLPPGTAITSFAPTDGFPAWREFLDRRGDDPWHRMLEPFPLGATLMPGATLSLVQRSGPGWLRGIRLQVPYSARALIRLRVRVDDATSTDMPLEDFFAAPATAIRPTRGLFFGQAEDGSLYSWWPIPFDTGLDVELIADAALPMPLDVVGSLAFDNTPVAGAVGRFQASLLDQCLDSGAMQMLEETGAGKIVGIAARYRAGGAVGRGYLEGEERVVLDHATAPAWYGTGLEDFFDAGFYFDRGEFSSPLSGASEVDPDGQGTTATYRILATDPILYSSAIDWTQELGFSLVEPVPMCARTVIYRYRRESPTTRLLGRFEVGDPAAITQYAYELPADTRCALRAGQFSDEPPTAREAVDCRYENGSSRFRFHAIDPGTVLRLRRTFDAAHGEPGREWSAPAAQVRVNATLAGWFPPAPSNPARRWQQQEILLAGTDFGGGEIDVVVSPRFEAGSGAFGESAWELRGSWVDPIFSATFDDTTERDSHP